MAGFDAPYVPGWDCHGLPIELKVDKELGPKKREMSAGRDPPRLPRLRREVTSAAARGVQAAGRLRRLGRPVPHDGAGIQAAIVRALGTFRRAGARLQGQEAGALVHPLTARRSPRPRSSTRPHLAVDLRRVPARRTRRRDSWPRACRRSPAATCRWSSGRRRRGPSRRTWRSRSTRSSTTRRTTSTAALVIVAEALAEATFAKARSRRSAQPVAREGRASSSGIRVPSPVGRARFARRARPTTSRSSRAPARSTRRRATAPTTSSPASATGSTSTRRSDPAGEFPRASSCSAA